MDMRHVLVVGYLTGEIIGNVVEHIQFIIGRTDTAYDPQDYYSNRMGDYFHQMRNMGTWASDSWAYDFQRFILTQYSGLQNSIIPKQYEKHMLFTISSFTS